MSLMADHQIFLPRLRIMTSFRSFEVLRMCFVKLQARFDIELPTGGVIMIEDAIGVKSTKIITPKCIFKAQKTEYQE